MRTSSRFSAPVPGAGRQQGVVLVIALIMLMLVTMVSVSTVSITSQQEKMAGNMRDRNLAFQAAEAAVQYCLGQLKSNTAGWVTSNAQTPTVPPTAPLWQSTNWTSSPSISVTMGTGAGLNSNPRCLVEDMGSGNYRVTGRAEGRSDKAVVILQATYSPS